MWVSPFLRRSAHLSAFVCPDSNRSIGKETLPASAGSSLFPWRVLFTLLLTLAGLTLLNASVARGAEYPTSLNYGGANKSVDILSEWTAVEEAMDASSDEGASLWFGLSPEDQGKNAWLNPVNRTAIEEGFPEEATDSPFADAGRLYDGSGDLWGGTPTVVAPGGWCYGGLTAAGEATLPVTWLRLIDFEYAKGGASFRLGVHALSYTCGNGRTRAYFLVRANGKTLPQKVDGVRPEYQVQVVRGNGEKRSSPLLEIDPDTNNLLTPYGIAGGYTRVEFSQPNDHSAAGLDAKEIRVPVRVFDVNEGAMRPVTLWAKFWYTPIANPRVTRTAQEEEEQEEAAPIASTETATDVTLTSAKLTGWVNPSGGATNYTFEYGKNGYENSIPVPAGSIGSGTSNVFVWNVLSGLEAGVEYHFRVVASNASGITYGEDQTFYTPPGPSVTTNPATEITSTSARLAGSVNPNGENTDAYFSYGSVAYTNMLPKIAPGWNVGSGTQPVSVSGVATELEPNTTYTYRLMATSSKHGGLSVERTFTTLPGPPRVRVAPPGDVTSTKATLGAEVDGEGQPTTYYYEYGRTIGYGLKTSEKALPSGDDFQPAYFAVEGLPVSWTLHYRVVAKSGLGTTYGADQVVTTGWRNEPTSGIEPDGLNRLNDVSCSVANDCVAVGSYVASQTGTTKLAASLWNGNVWASIDPVTPAGIYAELNGVSCTAANNCLAVGYVRAADSSVRPLIMKWNGVGWSEVSAGAQIPTGKLNFLNDVSCPAANSCEAVGYSTSTSGTEEVTLALHWDGSAWTRRPSANPTAQGNSLFSVACASPTLCKAVGRNFTGAYKGLIVSLSGSEWVAETPDTTGYPASEYFWLDGVSCPTTTTCLAVGYSGEGSTKKAFTQRWNGFKWVNQPVLSEPNGATRLYDVACSSPTFCRAVGADGRALHWTGARWLLQAPKPPIDLQSIAQGNWRQLNGIACPTATECHAVGTYIATSTQRRRLAQGWSGLGAVLGASWTVATSLGENGATLNGRANSAGVDADYYFEYGRTTAYGTKTPQASAGSDNYGPKVSDWSMVSTPITGLTPGAEYHYRLVLTNGTSTAYGADTTFKTKSRLGEMPVTEAFNATSTNVSDFATKWAPLQWTGSARKGKNNANGYGPADTAANGAYFMPTVTDGGPGIATEATIATGPGVGGRVSLWLDMVDPGARISGYELSLQETAASTYTLTLRWRVGTSEKVLATQAGYSLVPGSRIALVDKGSELSAWANTGSGYVKVIGASDSQLSSGSAGIEVQGQTTTRLTNFKVGPFAEKEASFDAALKPVALIDDFARAESQLSLGGAWAALPWSPAVVKSGKVDATIGWTPAEPSAIAGAYWQKAMASDTGSGDVAQVTSKVNFNGSPSSYFALWLNAPNPGSARSGYQLRLHGGNYFALEAKLYKWVNSVPTLLGSSKIDCQFGTAGVRLALVDRGGTLSVWSAQPGGTFTQAFSASDTTYSYGYGGVEGLGTSGLKDFKLGQLSPF